MWNSSGRGTEHCGCPVAASSVVRDCGLGLPGLSRTGLLCVCTTDMWGCIILSWDCPCVVECFKPSLVSTCQLPGAPFLSSANQKCLQTYVPWGTLQHPFWRDITHRGLWLQIRQHLSFPDPQSSWPSVNTWIWAASHRSFQKG